MGAKGLKKIDNFKKKQDEINMWKRNSNADDVEYMECQMEMEQQLQQSYTGDIREMFFLKLMCTWYVLFPNVKPRLNRYDNKIKLLLSFYNTVEIRDYILDTWYLILGFLIFIFYWCSELKMLVLIVLFFFASSYIVSVLI